MAPKGKAKSNSKSNNSKKKEKEKNSSSRKTPSFSPSSAKFLTCPETGEKIFVATATLQDIKRPPKASQRKVLYKVPSQKVRDQLYDELALCLEDRETRLLPPYGGRPWSVVAKVSNTSNANVKHSSPFFRYVRGKLELAVLPHLLDKIPNPPKFPGYIHTEYGIVRQQQSTTCSTSGEEDDSGEKDPNNPHIHPYENLTEEEKQRMTALLSRDITTLSQVAWEYRNDRRMGAPLPSIVIKWICPLRQIFTSRKAAWDHALALAKAEQYIDRYIEGVGANGKILKPFRPSRPQALQAGKVRFLRDGIWVVGQEQAWQTPRMRQFYKQERAEQQEPPSLPIDNNNEEEEDEAPPPKKRKLSGILLYVAVHRMAVRDAGLEAFKEQQRQQKEQEKLQKKLQKKQKQSLVKEEEGDDANEEGTTTTTTTTTKQSQTASKVGMPVPAKKSKTNTSKQNQQSQAATKISYTLTEVDRDLRKEFRKLDDQQRQKWEVKAATSFQRKLEEDDHARWDLQYGNQSSDDDDDDDDDSSSSSEEEEESDSEEEENSASESSNGDGEKEEVDNNEEEEKEEDVVMKDTAEDESVASSEESSVVQLATEEERRLWELLSEAEQEVWKDNAAKKVKASCRSDITPLLTESANTKTKKNKKSIVLSPYEGYQERVFDQYFHMTVKRYEKMNALRMQPKEKNKYLNDCAEQKELLEQGIKLLLPAAHGMMETQVEQWIAKPLLIAKRKEEKDAKRKAAKALAAKAAAAAAAPSKDARPAKATSNTATGPLAAAAAAPTATQSNTVSQSSVSLTKAVVLPSTAAAPDARPKISAQGTTTTVSSTAALTTQLSATPNMATVPPSTVATTTAKPNNVGSGYSTQNAATSPTAKAATTQPKTDARPEEATQIKATAPPTAVATLPDLAGGQKTTTMPSVATTAATAMDEDDPEPKTSPSHPIHSKNHDTSKDLTKETQVAPSQFAPISPSPPLVMDAHHHEKDSHTDSPSSSQEPPTQEVVSGGKTTEHEPLATVASTETQDSGKCSGSSEREESHGDDAQESKEASDEESSEESEEEEEDQCPVFIPTEHYCLSEDQIKLCLDAILEHFDAVMRTVKAKDLTRELVDGFDVLRERGRGRYDMELPIFDTPKFNFLNDMSKAPWMPIVRQVLGDDVVLIHKGCFLSLPDATNQPYHQDGLHLHSNSQRPCHAVNVFTPLVDMTLQHGPTEFCLGSHILGQEDWDRRYLYTPLPKKGVPVMFDYRLGHRGLANTSKEPRPIVYCTYARASDGKEFRDSVNFSRKRYRKLGDIVEKPLSRDERSQKRRATKNVYL